MRQASAKEGPFSDGKFARPWGREESRDASHKGEPGLALKYMDDQYKQDSLTVLGNIVTSSLENPQPEPDKEKAEEVLMPIGIVLAQQYGNDLTFVTTGVFDKIGVSQSREQFSSFAYLLSNTD